MSERRIYWWLLVNHWPWWMLETWEWCERVISCHHNARVLTEMEYRFGCVLDHMGTGMSKAYYTLPAMYAEIDRAISEREDEALLDEMEPYQNPRAADLWHEDDGPVVWWKFPVDEPPYVGTPLDDTWPGYHTHWTHIVEPVEPGETIDVD